MYKSKKINFSKRVEGKTKSEEIKTIPIKKNRIKEFIDKVRRNRRVC